jgi:hypothetical protein
MLHGAFGRRPGEILTGIQIDLDGIRGNFVSSPNAESWFSDTEILNFTRKAKSFAGKELCFRMMLDDTKHPLREQRGKHVTFIARPQGKLVKLRGLLPTSLEVPEIEWSDLVLVRFRCNLGSRYFGNTVTSVRVF